MFINRTMLYLFTEYQQVYSLLIIEIKFFNMVPK